MREEENKKSVRPLNTKWYKKKRWIYPAVYLGFAAVILASVLWYQNSIGENLNEEADPAGFEDQEAVPAVSDSEVFKSPVDKAAVNVQRKFYDSEASAAEQEAALVFYNNTYFQNKGINYATESGEPFDVMASLSGKVVKADQEPLLGYVVHIEHDNGVVTHYSSLADVQVEKGDTIKQGQVLGTAGMNLLDKEAKIHVHFEVRKDGVAVNPLDYFNKTVTDIPDQKQSAEEKAGTVGDEGASTDQAEADQDVTSDPAEADDANTNDGTQPEGEGADTGSSTDSADETDDAQPQENSIEDEDQTDASRVSESA
ncbi:peptidoglycan DD-metalloendopeptidase family protein [Alkalihalobacillus sp. AL-G]|uniref:peptidoglycan DD-metalloendopeptidase family protein n=1 Tax=Alkalihalobacillus sp. AL-G TaxID=2926399 RepID=UPI00272D0960|nr:peptidoglycan DD-metalloendopeptidase family protein [Alkalihalobacillus sp. AL-G]WLD93138.1 peptidoglycan DD-metalloendopeptidase family protein [Alkalihalobacillus sp. AL-G]